MSDTRDVGEWWTGAYRRAYAVAIDRVKDMVDFGSPDGGTSDGVIAALTAIVSRELGDDQGAARRVIGWAVEDVVTGRGDAASGASGTRRTSVAWISIGPRSQTPRSFRIRIAARRSGGSR